MHHLVISRCPGYQAHESLSNHEGKVDHHRYEGLFLCRQKLHGEEEGTDEHAVARDGGQHVTSDREMRRGVNLQSYSHDIERIGRHQPGQGAAKYEEEKARHHRNLPPELVTCEPDNVTPDEQSDHVDQAFNIVT